METYKIKQLTAVGAGIVLLLLIISYALHQNQSSSPLDAQNYTNIISNKPATFYASKGLEVQSIGPTFSNTDALNVVGSQQVDDTLKLLQQFVNAQSHFESRAPVISGVQKTSNASYRIEVFLDSSEQLLDVTVTFDRQKVPSLTYKVDTDAQI